MMVIGLEKMAGVYAWRWAYIRDQKPCYELSDIVKATECLAGVNANHKETIDGLEFDVLAAMTYFSSAKQAVGLSTELPEFQ